jgi:hypothetical protein
VANAQAGRHVVNVHGGKHSHVSLLAGTMDFSGVTAVTVKAKPPNDSHTFDVGVNGFYRWDGNTRISIRLKSTGSLADRSKLLDGYVTTGALLVTLTGGPPVNDVPVEFVDDSGAG